MVEWGDGSSAGQTLADMKASNFRMGMMSRTMGTLRRVTGSAVSNAAAIAGSAEFFAPLIVTVPCSGLPPRIRNLSIHLFLFTRPMRGADRPLPQPVGVWLSAPLVRV